MISEPTYFYLYCNFIQTKFINMNLEVQSKLQRLTVKLREDKLKSIAANEEKRQHAKRKCRIKAKERSQKKRQADAAQKLTSKNKERDVSVTVTVNLEHAKEHDKTVSHKIKPLKRKASNSSTKKNIKKSRKNGANAHTDMQRKKIKDRVQKHRASLSEEAVNIRREKDREYRRKRKEQKLDKPIIELPERQQRKKRKIWRRNSKAYRERQTVLIANTTQEINNDTINNDDVSDRKSARQKQRVTKRRSKIVKKLKTELDKKKHELSAAKNKIERYRKRLQRAKVSTRANLLTGSPSPATKIRKLTVGTKISPSIRKRLVFGELLATELRRKKMRSTICKQVISKVATSHMMIKYKMIGYAKRIVNYREFRKFVDYNSCTYDKRVVPTLMAREARRVATFLEDDENSRMCPGKRDGTKKFQKRILLNSLKELHSKYKIQYNSSMSYSSFLRLKPMWIVPPRLCDRETCMCSKHGNMQFVVEKLHRIKVLAEKNAEKVCAELCCNVASKECMYRECVKCQDKVIEHNLTQDELNENVAYFQWSRKTENRSIKGKDKLVTSTYKAVLNTSVTGLYSEFKLKIVPFMKHVYNMRHQYRSLKSKKDHLQQNEIVVQIDFSENYVCKFGEEAQSMHFGASKVQISLHTGVKYVVDSNGNTIVESFTTVSSCLDHGAHAIWAHLKPVLLSISVEHPEVNTMHIVSDGPTAQYKNRFNLWYISKMLPALCPNITQVSWNFSEAGHGKGPMDGVGGVLKRTADRHVCFGNDVGSVSDFVALLQTKTSIAITEISGVAVADMKKLLPDKVSAIPGILDVHQVTWTAEHPSVLFTRFLSCFDCKFDDDCTHYKLGKGSATFRTSTSSILLILVYRLHLETVKLKLYRNNKKSIFNYSNL